MSLATRGGQLRLENCGISAPILFRRDWFNMCRSVLIGNNFDACVVATEMIHLQTIRNGSDQQFIGNAVSKQATLCPVWPYSELAIAFSAFTLPEPTPRTLLDLGPKAIAHQHPSNPPRVA
jgi:hypothetical protein